ncbi:MAG: hypothetical protein Q27BPR15_04235 [Rhodobacter sp. CACIA14H1]|nr:MAG: hypothetical protein Q27BPR15_04235 [Rhodobacter sp. CACIA14H1]
MAVCIFKRCVANDYLHTFSFKSTDVRFVSFSLGEVTGKEGRAKYDFNHIR